jgi:hypothetical protein
MSDGFKKIFTNDRKDQQMNLPISGYSGHRRGYKAQNLFGQSFRKCTIQSKAIDRQYRNKSPQV